MGYTAEDENLIKEKWDDLLLSCTKICKNDEDWNFIKRAFFLAKEAHEGVRRRSGEPYLLHPIAVAKIVIEEIGLGVKSVVAALLHDVGGGHGILRGGHGTHFRPENRLDGRRTDENVRRVQRRHLGAGRIFS